jgi:hypothetical protein
MILHTYSITNDTTNDLGLISVPQALSACSKKERFSCVAQILHDLDRLNGLFDDTINNICHQIHAFTTSDNECYKYSQMLQQNDCKQFFQAMENELEDQETRKHWILMLRNNMPPGAKTIMAI